MRSILAVPVASHGTADPTRSPTSWTQHDQLCFLFEEQHHRRGNVQLALLGVDPQQQQSHV